MDIVDIVKKQREYLMNPQTIDLLKKTDEKIEDHASNKENGKTLSFTNGTIKGFETPYNQYQKNGYVNILLLSVLTFLFESLFLVISYMIFR